jgi:hypothetical protein
VHERDQFVAREAQPCKGCAVEYLLHRLQLGEMIPAAKRAEGFRKLRRAQFLAREPVADVAFPWMFEVEP